MAKTKRKQLAALAALKVTSPELPRKSTEEHKILYPVSNDDPCDKSSGSHEVRQQRIIIWIPSSDPAPRLVNSRRFRISGTPSRKRKECSDNDEENTSSDAEDGHVYKKYAKIILKLDSGNIEKNIEPPPSLNAPPLIAERSYQRRKPDSRNFCKERVLSVLTVNKNLPASSSVPGSKKTKAVDKDEHLPGSLSVGDGENANDVSPGETMAREPSSRFSRRLRLRPRKTLSHRDLVFAKPIQQGLRNEQEETITSRKMIIKPPGKFVSDSEKEVNICPEKTQEKASSICTRQKLKLLKDTVPQHEPIPTRLEVTSHSDDQQKSRSAENMRSDPESSVVGVGATTQLAKGTELKTKSKLVTRNTAVLGTPKTTTEPTNDDLELARYSDNPSFLKENVSVLRPSSKVNNSSRVSKVKLQKRPSTILEKQDGVVPLHTSVLRIRKRGQTQTGRSTIALEANLVKEVAALDNFKDLAGLGRPSTIEVRNSESSAGLPSVDEANDLHHGSDVVTSSNNAALNSRIRRISFLGRQAGTSEEELKRVNRGLNVQRENSHVNSVTTSGRVGVNGNNQLRAKVGWAATSLHHLNEANGHAKLIRQEGYLKSQLRLRHSALTSHHGVDRPLQTSSLGHPWTPYKNPSDMAALVRLKLEEVGGLTEWLIGGGLGVFVDLFQERKIEGGDLLHLTMSSLKEIGVHAVGPRRKLIWMIEHLL